MFNHSPPGAVRTMASNRNTFLKYVAAHATASTSTARVTDTVVASRRRATARSIARARNRARARVNHPRAASVRATVRLPRRPVPPREGVFDAVRARGASGAREASSAAYAARARRVRIAVATTNGDER